MRTNIMNVFSYIILCTALSYSVRRVRRTCDGHTNSVKSIFESTRPYTRQAMFSQLVLDYKIRSTLMLRPSDCSLADLLETDLAVNILSLTRVYLDVASSAT